MSVPQTSKNSCNADLPIVAIAGGSGFVGTSLRIALAHKFRWQALTRSLSVTERDNSHDNTVWQRCDLFCYEAVKQALTGARYGLYLVHSMLPSSRLVQGSFADMDLLLADNFVRAAEAAGIEHIIYLGGLIPSDIPQHQLSQHLSSRLEVESVLRSRSVTVSVIRAGLIFGPGGSSMRMLINLVRNLPLMILPKWTRSLTQSTDYRNIIQACERLLEDPQLHGGTYDIGGHDSMLYRTMILKTAHILKRRLITLNLPLNIIGFSRLWVAVFGKVSPTLVNPLLDSLKHNLVAAPNALQEWIAPTAIPFEKSVKDAIDEQANPLPSPRNSELSRDGALLKRAKRVRSIQRMPLPDNWLAKDLAHCYFNWLARKSKQWLAVDIKDDCVRLDWRVPRRTLLNLRLSENPEKRQRRCAYTIESGLLVRKNESPGRFDFVVFPDNQCAIIAIHDYAPALSWWLYQYSQANLHLFVMKAFRKHLEKEYIR